MDDAVPPLDPAKFRRLLAEARAGSSDALGMLIQWRRTILESQIAGDFPCSLRSKVNASDIFQEAAVEAHRDFLSFLGASEGEFFAWLKAIVDHTLRDMVRYYEGVQKRDIKREVRLGDGSGSTADERTLGEERNPELSAIRHEEDSALQKTIDQLCPDHRTVIDLRIFEDLHFKDVGARMGRSEGGARKLFDRAVRALKKRGPPGRGDDSGAGSLVPRPV